MLQALPLPKVQASVAEAGEAAGEGVADDVEEVEEAEEAVEGAVAGPEWRLLPGVEGGAVGP